MRRWSMYGTLTGKVGTRPISRPSLAWRASISNPNIGALEEENRSIAGGDGTRTWKERTSLPCVLTRGRRRWWSTLRLELAAGDAGVPAADERGTLAGGEVRVSRGGVRIG